MEVIEGMTKEEMIKISVEEFARLQKYMILTSDKESAAYKDQKCKAC